jgi:small subunit ribosomal protein S5
MRAIFESLGIHDIVAKSVGTSNPYNMVRATFDALKNGNSPRSIAAKRGKTVAEIFSRKDAEAAAAAAEQPA